MTTEHTHPADEPAGRNELPRRPALTPADAEAHRAEVARLRALADTLSRVTGLTWHPEPAGHNVFADRGPFTVGIGLHDLAPDVWCVWTADEAGRTRASRDLRPHGMPDDRFAAVAGPIAVRLLNELNG